MTLQNDANKNPEALEVVADVPAATNHRHCPDFVCNKTVLLVTSLLSLLLLATVAGIAVVTFQAPHPPVNDTRAYNVTMWHLTDGEEPLFELDESVDKRSRQSNPSCTHTTNADYTSSSTYSSSYKALKAFEGPEASWSSKKLSRSNFAQQWINIAFQSPTNITRISFRGDPSYPENTPTRYELQGKDLSTHPWTSLMTARHPNYKKYYKRSHKVSKRNQRKFQQYRLVIHQTIWLENDWEKGYVQISNLEMCWG